MQQRTQKWCDDIIVNPPKRAPRRSWWAEAPRAGFTAQAEAERTAMVAGPLGEARCLAIAPESKS